MADSKSVACGSQAGFCFSYNLLFSSDSICISLIIRIQSGAMVMLEVLCGIVQLHGL